MIIYFGLELDDLVYPKQSDISSASAVGYHYCGAKQFLALLEIHLGVVGHTLAVEHLRIEQYRQAIRTYLRKNPTVFYKASFEADELATATALLERRDELILAEWNFEIQSETPNRLKVLAAIEQTLITLSNRDSFDLTNPKEYVEYALLSPGFADRFILVMETLKKRSLPIQHIYLNEPLDLLPSYFQKLFKLLSGKGIEIETLYPQKPSRDTDLDILKNVLWQKENGKRSKVPIKADGSLIILKAKRETEAAVYLSKLLQKNPTYRPVCLIPEKNRALDNALIQDGLPSLGIHSASLARPVLQILKLVTAFLWKPLDPYKIMEFVSLSVKPLREDLAYLIANQLAQTPGLKGERWNSMIRIYFEALEKKAASDSSINTQKIREQYNFWFERTLYDSSRAVPKDEVIKVFSYLSNWATKEFELSGNKQNSLIVLQEQAKRVHELLLTLPEAETQLTHLQLERIVRTIYEPSPIVFKESQQGRLSHVHHSSAFIGDIQDLVWWNFSAGEPNYFFAKWYKKELDYLNQFNIQLPTPKDQNSVLLWQRPRPFLYAQNSVLLVIPEMVDGVATQPHPLWSDIEATFEHLENIIIDANQLSDHPLLEHFNIPENITIEPKRLDNPKPYLDVTKREKLGQREVESFTSLESLFYYPYQWVFRHKLELHKTSILSVVKDTTLMGNLAHRLFEFLFHEKDVLTWNKQQVTKWVDRRVTGLLEREGAVLLMYGREPEKTAFINTLKFSTWSLLSMIQNNGWQIYATEKNLEGNFQGIPVKGKADLVLQNAKGEFAIVDLKWRGAARRKRIIKNEEDLQLVMYSKLLINDTAWAHTAYFIIESGQMIARNNLGFNEALAVAPDKDHVEINQRIWKRMQHTFEWRMNQLKSGSIEIRTEDTLVDLVEPGEGMSVTELVNNFLAMKSNNAPYDDYQTLINVIE